MLGAKKLQSTIALPPLAFSTTSVRYYNGRSQREPRELRKVRLTCAGRGLCSGMLDEKCSIYQSVG